MQYVQTFIGHYNYFITIFLMVAGLYIVIARGNMIKKLVGLALFQTSVYLLYIEPGKIIGGTAPILDPAFKVYSNPLHTADPDCDRLGVATLALAWPSSRAFTKPTAHRGGRDFRPESAEWGSMSFRPPGSASRHSTSRCCIQFLSPRG